MRQLLNSTYITLDGVIELPQLWPVLERGTSEEDEASQTDPGGDIVQYDFGEVSQPLLDHRLLHQLGLWIHPHLVGLSDPSDLLCRAGTTATFALVESRVLSNGILAAYAV